jgi:hypothetical protein
LQNLEKDQFKNAQDYLSRFIPEVCVACYFDHWQSELKLKLQSEFVEKMNDAEQAYSESRSRFPVFGFDGLFLDLAKRIVVQCHLQDQWDFIRAPLSEVIDAQWKRATFKFSEIHFQEH